MCNLEIYMCSVQFSTSVVSDSNPMDCSMPGFPVYHQLLELAQSHVHQDSDAIQPSHPLLSPSPSVFNLSHHQGLFKWVSSSYQVAKVLEFQLQLMNEYLELTMNIQDWFPLGLTGLISLQSKGLSRVFSSTTVQKHQFFSYIFIYIYIYICYIYFVLYFYVHILYF